MHALAWGGHEMGPLPPLTSSPDPPGFAYQFCHNWLQDPGPFAFSLSPGSPETFLDLQFHALGVIFFLTWLGHLAHAVMVSSTFSQNTQPVD